MQSTRAVNICKKHNQEIIVLDCSEEESQSDNQLCLKCLAPFLKKQHMVTVDNALETMSNIKQEFSLAMESQNVKNLEKIKILLSDIIQTKTTINQYFDKLIENLQQWISSFEEQNSTIKQKVDELCTLSTKEFQQALIEIQQNNTSIIELKATIQQQLTQIAQFENIQKSLGQLNSIELIQQSTDCKLVDKDQDYVQDTKKTPNLKLICNEHNTEIIMLDINHLRNSEMRLGCVYCCYDYKAQYTPIKIVEEQWNQYKKQEINQINKLQEQENQKINQLKQIFQSLGQVYISTINEICIYLVQNLQDIDQLITQHSYKLNRDWNSYNREEIIKIAEILSKTQVQQNEEKYFNQKDKQINITINNHLL